MCIVHIIQTRPLVRASSVYTDGYGTIPHATAEAVMSRSAQLGSGASHLCAARPISVAGSTHRMLSLGL